MRIEHRVLSSGSEASNITMRTVKHAPSGAFELPRTEVSALEWAGSRASRHALASYTKAKACHRHHESCMPPLACITVQ